MSGDSHRCFADLLFLRGKPADSPALLAPGHLPVTFGDLREQIARAAADLAGMGYRRNDRIAIVLPNGVEMAVALLSVMAGFTAAPLNPSSTREELGQYFAALRVAAVIVRQGSDSSVRDVARAQGVKIIELYPLSDRSAGIFRLTGEAVPPEREPPSAECRDTPLILFTSGTTSRPRMVPVTGERLAVTVDLFLEKRAPPGALGYSGCNVNVLPLFHLQGLVYLLYSLAAGISVVCAPGYSPAEYLRRLHEYRPLWCSANPVIMQGLLDLARADPGVKLPGSIAHFQSSGASLSPALQEAFERAFGIPVVSQYGMTECSSIAVNPPPPFRRKPGSVGVRGASEIAILSPQGQHLPAGEPGEIVVRGPTVMPGYLDDPGATEQAFVDGWFRTGDYGYLDPDGYLFIMGRIKELINRGGEKVSPYEVEAALSAHPGVRENVVFPVPDPSLGEQVAAAVVLRPGVGVTAEGLRRYARGRLAPFKVPALILLVDAIPKNDNDKPQRLAMAKLLGVTAVPSQASSRPAYVPPADSTEEAIAGILADVFGLQRAGADDHFFDLGGDSPTAARLFAGIERRFGLALPLDTVFEAPTVRQLARVVRVRKARAVAGSLIELKSGGGKPPLFCLHNLAGGLFDYYVLATYMAADRPIYGLQPPSEDATPPDSIRAMASRYIGVIKAAQPAGPYHLLGYCFGGSVAYEIARQLREAGEQVAFLGLIERLPPDYRYGLDTRSARKLAGRGAFMAGNVLRARGAERRKRLRLVPVHAYKFAARRLFRGQAPPGASAEPELPEWIACQPASTRSTSERNLRLAAGHYPGEYEGEITLFVSEKTNAGFSDALFYDPRMGWEKFVGREGRIASVIVPGDHHAVMQRPHVITLAAKIEEQLENAARGRPQ